MTTLAGSCLCKKNKFQMSSAPLSAGICFCRQCQKSGAALGSPLAVILKEHFLCEGTALSVYFTQSNRGASVKRYFCSSCGSPVYSEIVGIENIVTVKLALLESQFDQAFDYQVWVKRVPPGVVLDTSIPSFQEAAPLELVMGLS